MLHWSSCNVIISTKKSFFVNARGILPAPYPVCGVPCWGKGTPVLVLTWGEGATPVLVLSGGGGCPCPVSDLIGGGGGLPQS